MYWKDWCWSWSSSILVIWCELIGKVPDAGKDQGQKEKSASEDEMAGWHHRCNEHELGQTPGDGEGQGGLTCCSPWGHKELDVVGNWITTEFLEILWPGIKNIQKLNENQKKEDGVTCSAQVVSLSLSLNVGFCPSCLGRCSIKLQSRRYMLQVEILIGCWFWHMLWHWVIQKMFPPKFAEILCLLRLTVWHVNSSETEYGSILPLPSSTQMLTWKLLWQDDQRAEFISEQLSYFLLKFVPLTFIMSFVWYVLECWGGRGSGKYY